MVVKFLEVFLIDPVISYAQQVCCWTVVSSTVTMHHQYVLLVLISVILMMRNYVCRCPFFVYCCEITENRGTNDCLRMSSVY